jgi:hypothetical protein
MSLRSPVMGEPIMDVGETEKARTSDAHDKSEQQEAINV